jgi:hypothetical protein
MLLEGASEKLDDSVEVGLIKVKVLVTVSHVLKKKNEGRL